MSSYKRTHVLIRRDMNKPPLSLSYEDTARRWWPSASRAVRFYQEPRKAGALITDFQLLELWKNQCLWFKTQSVQYFCYGSLSRLCTEFCYFCPPFLALMCHTLLQYHGKKLCRAICTPTNPWGSWLPSYVSAWLLAFLPLALST